MSGTTVWVVIDEGCQECGVMSAPIGIYRTKHEAETVATNRDAETGGWRDMGQTIARYYEMTLPGGES